jgi:hypothetical protein
MFNNCVCVSISEIVFKGMSCGMVLGVLFKKKKKKKEGKKKNCPLLDWSNMKFVPVVGATFPVTIAVGGGYHLMGVTEACRTSFLMSIVVHAAKEKLEKNKIK